MTRTRLCLAAVALATASLAAPADADGARACVDIGTATFQDRLTPVIDTTNSVTFTYTLTCAGANDGGGSGLQLFVPSSRTYAVSGSCVTASLTGPDTTGILVGGVAGTTITLFGAWPTGEDVVGTRTFVLVPTDTLGNPCDMKTATFVATGGDVVV